MAQQDDGDLFTAKDFTGMFVALQVKIANETIQNHSWLLKQLITFRRKERKHATG